MPLLYKVAHNVNMHLAPFMMLMQKVQKASLVHEYLFSHEGMLFLQCFLFEEEMEVSLIGGDELLTRCGHVTRPSFNS